MMLASLSTGTSTLTSVGLAIGASMLRAQQAPLETHGRTTRRCLLQPTPEARSKTYAPSYVGAPHVLPRAAKRPDCPSAVYWVSDSATRPNACWLPPNVSPTIIPYRESVFRIALFQAGSCSASILSNDMSSW